MRILSRGNDLILKENVIIEEYYFITGPTCSDGYQDGLESLCFGGSETDQSSINTYEGASEVCGSSGGKIYGSLSYEDKATKCRHLAEKFNGPTWIRLDDAQTGG